MPSVVSSLTNLVQSIFQSIWNLFATILGVIQSAFATVFGLISSLVNAVLSVFVGLLNGIGNIVKGFGDLIGGTVTFVWGEFFSAWCRMNESNDSLANLAVILLLGGGYYFYVNRQPGTRSSMKKNSWFIQSWPWSYTMQRRFITRHFSSTDLVYMMPHRCNK